MVTKPLRVNFTPLQKLTPFPAPHLSPSTGCLFLTGAPLNSVSKIPFKISGTYKEIMSQFTWDLVLKELRGLQLKKKNPVYNVLTDNVIVNILDVGTIRQNFSVLIWV